MRSLVVIEVYIFFDTPEEIFFRFEAIAVQYLTLKTSEKRFHNGIVIRHPEFENDCVILMLFWYFLNSIDV